MKATARSGGKLWAEVSAECLVFEVSRGRVAYVYVNCRMQIAATTPVKPEKPGMAAAITKAIDQYTGTMKSQAILPGFVVRGGMWKISMRMLL